MRETDCNKGFTLIELMIVIAIIGILGTIIIAPMISNDAHGMEIQKLVPADDATTVKIAKAMRHDPHQTVTIVVYAKTWSLDKLDKIDAFMNKRDQVIKRLVSLGIYKHRITTLLANRVGLIEDKTPTPVTDGVYIYLD